MTDGPGALRRGRRRHAGRSRGGAVESPSISRLLERTDGDVVKRTALILTLVALAVSPAAAQAGTKGGTRTLSSTYSSAQGGTVDGVGSFNSNCSGGVGTCWNFSTVKGETSIAFSVKDSTGTPVAIQVFTGGDFNSVVTYCGAGTLDISPKHVEAVSVRPAQSPTCKALATSGTITAVLSKK
jgi:hypothetical protein